MTNTISGSEYGTIHTGTISDKTMSVATHYSGIAQRMNLEAVEQIRRELRALVQETSKLELYVSLLDASQARIIQLRDFEGKPWDELEKSLDASERSLRERRRAAIKELAVMYEFVDTLSGNNGTKE